MQPLPKIDKVSGDLQQAGETNMAQDGTQAIRRAAAILQQISRESGGKAPTLKNISEAMGLSRSTTHRILKCLTDTDLAAYDPTSRKYEIGMLTYELGLAVTDRILELAPWASTADRIARRANVTTYVMRRSGIEAVCVHKAEGRTVIRVIPVEVGQRRFLGVGAGATALLAGLPDDTVERVIAHINPELSDFEALTADGIREAVEAARKNGFAESHARAYRAIYGLGIGIRAHSTEPDIAISLAAHAPDVDDKTIAEWKAIILEEIAVTEAKISTGKQAIAT